MPNDLHTWFACQILSGWFLMKIFSLFFTIVFILFAVVQLNDPDPVIWVAIYLFSAYTAFCSFRNYYNPMLLMILVVAYAIGTIAWFPEGSVSEWINTEEKAKSLEMKMPFIEEARESMGLAICFLVNLIYMFVGFRKAKLPNYNFGVFFKSDEAERNTNL